MLTEVERANILRRTEERTVALSEPSRLRMDTSDINKAISKTNVEGNKIRLKLGSKR